MNLGWAKSWKEKNWWRTKSEKAINPDLWGQLLILCEKHQVKFIWVRGHTGIKENERCDQLSYQAAKRDNLPEDAGYDPNFKFGKTKITKEGDLCKKCNTPVVKIEPNHRKLKKKRTYYFQYFFHCPKCDTKYYTEDAKKIIKKKLSDHPSLF
jgi:ribonuclease HI